MTQYCECGCGVVPTVGRRFVYGHYSLSPEAREKVGLRTRGKVLKQFCLRGHDTFVTGRLSNGGCGVCLGVRYKKNTSVGESQRFRSKQRRWKINGFTTSEGAVFTYVDYDRLYQIQQGRCVVCKKHQQDLKHKLHVDHDHKTGVVRGLLCINCNTALGCVNDSVDVLNSLIGYLRSI